MENLKDKVVEQINEMILFKTEKQTKDGKPFDDFFLKYPNNDIYISCNLSNEVKAKLTVTKLKFPMVVTLRVAEIYDKEGNLTFERDYFIKDDKFINKYGEEQIKKVCVITDYRKVDEFKFASMSLDELFNNLTDLSK